METLAISMQAEWLLWARENASTPAGQKELKAAEGDFAKLLKRVKRLPLTDEAREAFGIAELSQTDFARISNSALEKAARAYLR